MKKFILPILLLTSSIGHSFEVEDSNLLKYTAPCAIGIVASYLLVKDNGVQVGEALCVTSLAVTYFNDTGMKFKDMKKETKEDLDKMWDKIKKDDDKHSSELGVFRDTIRRIIAEKIIEINTKTEDTTQKTIESKEFRQKISEEILKVAKLKEKSLSSQMKTWINKNKSIIEKNIEEELTRKLSKKLSKITVEEDQNDEVINTSSSNDDSDVKDIEEDFKSKEEQIKTNKNF